jgi:hypothetical protein
MGARMIPMVPVLVSTAAEPVGDAPSLFGSYVISSSVVADAGSLR